MTITLWESVQMSSLFPKYLITQNFIHTYYCYENPVTINSAPPPPQLCSPHPSLSLPYGLLHLILPLIWEPPASLHEEAHCAQIIWLFSDVEAFLQKGKNRVCPKALGYLANRWTLRGRGRRRDRCRAKGADTRVRKWPLQCQITNNVLSQLLQSSLWNIPLLRQPKGWRL